MNIIESCSINEENLGEKCCKINSTNLKVKTEKLVLKWG